MIVDCYLFDDVVVVVPFAIPLVTLVVCSSPSSCRCCCCSCCLLLLLEVLKRDHGHTYVHMSSSRMQYFRVVCLSHP